MSAFDDEFGLFGETVDDERRPTLPRKIASNATVIDEVEPRDDGAAAPHASAAARPRAPARAKPSVAERSVGGTSPRDRVAGFSRAQAGRRTREGHGRAVHRRAGAAGDRAGRRSRRSRESDRPQRTRRARAAHGRSRDRRRPRLGRHSRQRRSGARLEDDARSASRTTNEVPRRPHRRHVRHSRRTEVRPDECGSHRHFSRALACLRCAGDDVSVDPSSRGARPHKGRLLDLASRASTMPTPRERIRGAMLYAPRRSIASRDGEYLDADLVGCDVCGVDGDALRNGRARRALSGQRHAGRGRTDGADGGGDRQRASSCAARRIVIDPPPGLFDGASSCCRDARLA